MSSNYQFKIRVGAVLIKEGKLLLARQNDQPFWVLPGGTLEVGEGLGECIVREIREEANLQVSLGRLLYVGDFIKPPQPDLPPGHKRARLRQTLDAVFQVHYVAGELVMCQDENLNELDFFDVDTARAMMVQPAMMFQRLLADWVAGRLVEEFMADTSLARNSGYLGTYG